MKIKNIIYLLFILIMSCSVFSFNTFYQWGNAEKRLTGCNYWEFSSCYPQNDLSLNFSKQTLSQNMAVNPIIYFNQADNSGVLSKNLYLFSSTFMYIYNPKNFVLLNTNTLKGTILFEPNFIRFDTIFNGYLLVYPYSSGGRYYVNMCDADTDGNICINTDTTFEISNQTIDFIYDRVSGYTATLLSNGTIEYYEFLGLNKKSFYTGILPSYVPAKAPPNTDKYLSIGDFNSDGNTDLVFTIPRYYTNTGNVRTLVLRYGIYDLNDETFSLPSANKTLVANVETFGIGAVTNLRQNMVTLGSQSSSPHINIYISYTTYLDGAGSFNRRGNYIISQNGIDIYNDDTPSTYGTDSLNTNLVFTDANYDGDNEFCNIRRLTNPFNINIYNFVCYDSGLNRIINVTTSQQVYMSMGKYTNNSLESILLRDGIYEYNGTAINKIFNFTLSATDDVPYPLSVYDKVNYSNDVFIVSTNKIIEYKLSSPSAVCGDLICSLTETPVICPEDCFTENPILNESKKNPTVACQSDNQCLSGDCVNYRCSFLAVNQACITDLQCLSGQCTDNKCEQSSLSQKLDDWKNSTFGFDEATSNIIALVGIFLITIILAIVGFLVTKHFLPSIVLGALGFIASVVFFTYFGWLSGFILFTIIILVIGGIMLFIFLKGK